MKKLLLVGSLALGLGMGATAQKFESPVLADIHRSANVEVLASINNNAIGQFKPIKRSGSVDAKSGVSVIELATSANGYSPGTAGLPKMFVDTKTQAIVVVNKGDNVDYNASSEFYSYSTNGNDWVVSNNYAVSDETEMPRAYYPATFVVNPNNSSNIEDTYLSFITNNLNGDNGNRGSYTAGTITLGDNPTDNSHQEIVFDIDDEYKSGYFIDACSVGDKVFAVYSNIDYSEDPSVWDNSLILVKGQYDETAGKVVYTRSKIPVEEGIWSTPHGPRLAFDPTGQFGYFYCEGNKHEDLAVHDTWPTYIMKTTDGGETWSDVLVIDHNGEDKLDCIAEDFTQEDWDAMNTLTGGTDDFPGHEALVYGNLWQSDGFVDNDGNLHLACALDVYNLVDGSHYYIDYFKAHPIVHIYTKTTTDGSVEIGSEIVTHTGARGYTLPASDSYDGHTQAPQLVPTEDLKYALFMWSDSEVTYGGDEPDFQNDRPSIFARGYKLPDGDTPGEFVGESEVESKNGDIISNKVNLTFATAADEGAWFFSSANYLLNDPDPSDEIRSAAIPLKYFTFEGEKPESLAEPFTHNYLHGITYDFGPTGPVGLEAIEAANTVKVSQNMPNPFTGESHVQVELVNAANLSLEVVDLTGQTIQLIEKGQVNAGTHDIMIDASNLNAGIYFYTVTAGMNKITKKMLVK